MRMRALFLAASLVGGFHATAGAADCAAIQAEITEDLKRAALANALGNGSVPERASAQMTQALLQVQTNTQLLIAHQCPLPEKPITWRMYLKASGQCAVQIQRARMQGGNEPTPACDTDNWKPDP